LLKYFRSLVIFSFFGDVPPFHLQFNTFLALGSDGSLRNLIRTYTYVSYLLSFHLWTLGDWNQKKGATSRRAPCFLKN